MGSVLGTYISGTNDPTSVATYGEIGWLYVRTGTPGIYQKITTDGSDTNWQMIGSGGSQVYTAKYVFSGGPTLASGAGFLNYDTAVWNDIPIGVATIAPGPAWIMTAVVPIKVIWSMTLRFTSETYVGTEDVELKAFKNGGSVSGYVFIQNPTLPGTYYMHCTGSPITESLAAADFIQPRYYNNAGVAGRTLVADPDENVLNITVIV